MCFDHKGQDSFAPDKDLRGLNNVQLQSTVLREMLNITTAI